ncbi:ADP-ribosylation factor-related protein 1 [Hordeum vulgare]|nr:ADP-ribosylation factor-related protein 1 [Hordeum vulgare]
MPGTGHRGRQYLSVEVCQRYWEMRTSVPWSDVHLPNAWHLSADRVPIPPVPTSGHARCEEIDRHRRLLPDDLYYDPMYAAYSTMWDTWLRDEHDVRRASYLPGRSRGRGRHGVARAYVGAKEEEEVAVFPADLVGASWGWSCTASEMAPIVGDDMAIPSIPGIH